MLMLCLWLVMVIFVARKKLDDMSKVELEDTLKWYETQVRFIKFLLVDKFGA